MLEARLQTGALLKKVPTDTVRPFSGGTICRILGTWIRTVVFTIFCHHMHTGWIHQNQSQVKAGNDTSRGNLIGRTSALCMESDLWTIIASFLPHQGHQRLEHTRLTSNKLTYRLVIFFFFLGKQ